MAETRDVAARIAAAFPPAALAAVGAYLRKKTPSTKCYTPVSEHGFNQLRAVRAKKLIEVMIADKEHGLGAITTEAEALALGALLLQDTQAKGAAKKGASETLAPLLLRYNAAVSETGKSVKHKGEFRILLPSRANDRDARAMSASDLGDKSMVRFVFVYEESLPLRTVQLVALVAAVFACCMYQLWPLWARSIVWYCSVTLLLGILGVVVLQALLFALVWPTAWDFWLLPNFTSDTAPIWELFKPVYTLEPSATGSLPIRLAVVAAFAAAGFYVARLPPSEFREFMASQAKIVDDLYTGALLTDGSEGGADAAGLTTGRGSFSNPMSPFGSKWGPGSGRYGTGRASHISSLEEIEKATATEEEEAAAAEAAAVAEAAAAAAAAGSGGGEGEGGGDTHAEVGEGVEEAVVEEGGE